MPPSPVVNLGGAILPPFPLPSRLPQLTCVSWCPAPEALKSHCDGLNVAAKRFHFFMDRRQLTINKVTCKLTTKHLTSPPGPPRLDSPCPSPQKDICTTCNNYYLFLLLPFSFPPSLPPNIYIYINISLYVQHVHMYEGQVILGVISHV